ncbi:restriction endonuclease subunit S [Mycoplasmopsis gallinarum]|uniref:restriction endonuclease subunit S n=1 Tax=Mycoplasmopsis gallinarum TaxID=29557 RepID=UPI0006853371|nr:restriction endonuclease subunit S [Mycoplasmopsis gallinarum]
MSKKYIMEEALEYIIDYRGKTPKSSLQGIPTLSAKSVKNNFIDYSKCYYISKEEYDKFMIRGFPKKGDILLTTEGPLGQVAKLDREVVAVAQRLLTLRGKEKILDNDFLLYFLQSKKGQSLLKVRESGSTVSGIRQSEFRKIIIDLPEYKLQLKLVHILKVIDNKIYLNKKINDNLFNQLSTLYNYWFIQFEFPNNNFKPYKTNFGKFIYNEILNRNIPDNWKVETLLNNSISSIIKPGIEKFKYKTYYATADINNKNISEGSKIAYNNRKSRANMQPIKNSVWFAKMKNSIKHLFVTDNMSFMINDGILSTGFYGLNCNELSFEYISSFILSPYFEIKKNILSHGATQETINNDDLNSINILIPDKETLLKFHKITNPIYKKITENICSNRKLQEIRDFLLPLLMNGQVIIE